MAAEEQKVRVLKFDKAQWCSDIMQIQGTSVRWPHFSIIEPLPFVVGFREHAQRQRQIAR